MGLGCRPKNDNYCNYACIETVPIRRQPATVVPYRERALPSGTFFILSPPPRRRPPPPLPTNEKKKKKKKEEEEEGEKKKRKKRRTRTRKLYSVTVVRFTAKFKNLTTLVLAKLLMNRYQMTGIYAYRHE